MNIIREKGIFFIGADDKKDAYISFTENNGILTVEHTVVTDALKGQGIGKLLVKEVSDYAREHGLKVNSTCWFAKDIFNKNKEYEDIRT